MKRGRHRSTLANTWRVLGGALLNTALWTSVGAADLPVTVENVRSGAGQVKLMLFDKTDGFRKEDRAIQVLALPAHAGTVQGVLKNLAPGTYALVVYHDENNDGKLNLRLGMFPKEGYGLSNNPEVTGPPRFRDGAFDFTGLAALPAIRLDY